MKKFPKIRKWIGYQLRKYADRIDWEGAPRFMGWSFTFEHGEGIKFRETRNQGCPLAYIGNADYERAHTEADMTYDKYWQKGLAPEIIEALNTLRRNQSDRESGLPSV